MAFRVLPLDATLRPMRADDEDFLASLSARVFRPYEDDPADAMRRLLRSNSSEIALAVHGDTRLGFVVVHIEELGRDFGPLVRPSVAHLDVIAVRPTLAGQGLGRRLLAHAESIARAQGAVSMSLLTAETNIVAQRLFLAAGYQMLARLDDVYTGGQRAYSMFKALTVASL